MELEKKEMEELNSLTRIGKAAMTGKIIDFSDAVDIDKISVSATEYDSKNGNTSKYVRVYVPTDFMVVLADSIIEDRFKEFETLHSGSANRDGQIEARSFAMKSDLANENPKYRGFWINLTKGPGTKTQTGAFLPDKNRVGEQIKITIKVSELEMKRIMAAIRTRVQAHEVYKVARFNKLKEKKAAGNVN